MVSGRRRSREKLRVVHGKRGRESAITLNPAPRPEFLPLGLRREPKSKIHSGGLGFVFEPNGSNARLKFDENGPTHTLNLVHFGGFVRGDFVES